MYTCTNIHIHAHAYMHRVAEMFPYLPYLLHIETQKMTHMLKVQSVQTVMEFPLSNLASGVERKRLRAHNRREKVSRKL